MSDAPRINKLHVDAFERLHRLGQERVSIVDDMLIKGMSTHDVARTIQEDWGESTDVSHDAIRKMLDRYRTKVLAPKVSAFVAKNADKAVTTHEARRIYHQLDVMQEMTELLAIQKQRINKMLKREEGLPTLIGSVRGEIETASRILKELGIMQLETGILRRAPKTLTASIDDGTQVRRFYITENTDPDEVGQLLQDALDVITTEYTDVTEEPKDGSKDS
jgi:hypothetical protein